MKTNIKIPGTLYTQLYEEIMKRQETYIGEDDATQVVNVEIGNFSVCVYATFDVIYVDDSFSHAFGTEYGSHYESGELEDIEVESVVYFDGEDEEIDVTDKFNVDMFWNQFNRYGTRVRGIDIHHGDEVLVKYYTGKWEKMIYMFTDTRTGNHYCVRKLGDPLRIVQAMLPNTTDIICKIGKRNMRV